MPDIKQVPLSQLKEWEKNPRIIKDQRFKGLCKSLESDPNFMELRPILATKDGRIYAGNMRYRAAKSLGWKTIPAVITDIPEKLAQERAIKDNNQFGEWNDGLQDILKYLEEEGVDMQSLGLDENLKLLETPIEDVKEGDTPAKPKEPKAKLGDIYLLGDHRVMCGDSTSVDHVAKLMDGKKADMVFTDPPYNAAFNGRSGKFDVIKNDDLPKEEFEEFIREWFSTLMTLNVPEVYVCCDWKFMPFLMELSEYRSCIVWAKNVFSMGRGYRRQHEFILYKGVFESTTESDLWQISKDTNYQHPTQKPVELPARAIKNSTKQDDIVLDFFGGYGFTLMAAEQLNRKCYTMELDPGYVDVIVKRWENFTKKKAELLK